MSAIPIISRRSNFLCDASLQAFTDTVSPRCSRLYKINVLGRIPRGGRERYLIILQAPQELIDAVMADGGDYALESTIIDFRTIYPLENSILKHVNSTTFTLDTNHIFISFKKVNP